MRHPKRGEIYWVELAPTVGSEINKRRPAVVLSLDVFNARRDTVVVIPLSSKGTPRPPLVVSVPSAGDESNARIDQIRAVDKARLRAQLGKLSAYDLKAIEDGIRIVLGT